MSQGRPNVLHIILDQLAPHFLPAYGHGVVKAPNMTALSKRGFTFDSAYTNSPLCVPARAALVTGQLPSKLGIFDSGGELHASIPTVAHYLRHSGYHTCVSGKAHFIGPDQLHGFEDRLTTDMCMADFGMSGDWEKGETPLGFYHTMEAVAGSGIAERAAQQDHDEEATCRARQWLYDWARQPAETKRPFYLKYSLSQPHDPFVTPQRYWDLYEDDDIDMPAIPYIPVEERDPYSAWLYRHYDRDEYAITDEHIRTARRAYYGNISYVDQLIGNVLDTLGCIGEADNTIIVLCSDHGEMLGERGQWYKMSPYEESARVAMMISLPGQVRGERIAENVSLVDIAPTILDMTTGGDALSMAREIDPMDGCSMRALMEKRSGEWSNRVVSEMMFEGRMNPSIMVRDGAYKYVRIGPGSSLLFDLVEDPREMRNVAGDATYQEIEKRLSDYVDENWDFGKIDKEIRRDQRRRNFIQKTHYMGKVVSWDFQPFFDASRQYYRSHMTWLEAEKRNMLGPVHDQN